MQSRLTHADWKRLTALGAGLLSLTILGATWLGVLGVGIVLVLSVVVMTFLQLHHFRRFEDSQLELRRHLSEQRNVEFAQLEALLGLYFATAETLPLLPMTRGWAASPDFLRLVYDVIRKERPALAVELGSGSSTVIGGYALRQNGNGQMVSLDHLENYARETVQTLALHDLLDVCTVVHAPLVDQEVGSQTWQWYHREGLQRIATIDLLIVDGPPDEMQEMTRYPALPLLFPILSEGVVLLVDDGNREAETRMIARWTDEFPGFDVQFRNTEKGAYVLRRRPDAGR